MNYNKLTFILSIVCCLTLVVMGTVLFVIYGNVQAQIIKSNAEFGANVHQLQQNLSKLNEKMLNTEELLEGSGVMGKDCQELLEAGHTIDGVYTINVGSSPVQVACDMTNGGWTILQHRYDGSTNFRQDFQTYTTGFGDPHSEHWLGLENIHQLTRKGCWTLRVDLQSFKNDSAFAEYNNFKVLAGPEYRLKIGTYNGTAGDSMARNNGGRPFATYDRDTTQCSSDGRRNGAWWWKQKPGCGPSNINAYIYNSSKPFKGMGWGQYKRWNATMQMTMMKMRKV